MRDIVIALPSSVGLKELADGLIASPFETVGPKGGRLSVKLGEEIVQFVLDLSLSEHYVDPKEKALLSMLGKDPNLYLVNFKRTSSLGNVLAYTVDRHDALVDNDFGDIESGSAFVQHFREDPEWDWIRRQ